jgi:hypothetical protein
MKNIVLTLFLSYSCFALSEDEPKEFEIHLHLSKEFRGYDQWVYLVNLTTNEYSVTTQRNIPRSEIPF